MKNHIKEILFALCDGGVEYVVGGGVAAVLHGVERVTMDIDVAVNLTGANLERMTGVTRRWDSRRASRFHSGHWATRRLYG